MKLIAAFTLIVLATLCNATSHCQWGPSYWCQSRTIAQQCGQEQYCMNNVWKVEGLSVSESIGCTLCKLIVDQVDKSIETNKTESEAQQALDSFCSSIGPFAGECKKLVDQYFPQIWQYLMEQTDPSKVCSEIGLCTSTKRSEPSSFATKVGSVQCDVCELLIKQVQQLVSGNKTESEIEQELDDLCSKLGALGDECKTVVNEFLPQILKMISDEIDPEKICTIIGLCKNSARTKPPVSKVRSVQCDVCEMVIKLVEGSFLNNKTEKQAQQALDDLCSKLGSLGDECKTLVDDYFPTIWKMLVNEADPDTICTAIGLCKSAIELPIECDICDMVVGKLVDLVMSNSTEADAEAEVKKVCIYMGGFASMCRKLIDDNWDNLWDLVREKLDNPKLVCETIFPNCKSQTRIVDAILDHDEICKDVNLCPTLKRKPAPRPVLKAMPKQDLCDLCKLAVNFVKTYIDNSTDEAEVKKALEGLCGLLPSNTSTQCTKLVEDNFDMIWKLIKLEVDDGDICKQLGLCNSTLSLALSRAQTKVQPTQGVCDLCKLAAQFLKQYVDSNATEKEVQQAMESLCKILPSSISTECLNFANTSLVEIWKAVQTEVDTGKICTDLSLCSTAYKSAVLPIAGPACDVCKLLIGYLKPFADNQTAEDKAIQAVKNLCMELPDKYSQECQAQADKYVKQIWDEIRNDIDDGSACSVFCSAYPALALVKVPAPKSIPRQVKDSPLCSMCNMVVPFLRSYFDSNSTEEEAKDAVETVCNALPGSFKNECISLVEDNFDMIWKLLLSYVDDDEICKELKLCDNSTFTLLARTQSVKGVKCKVCEIAAKYLAKLIDSQTTESDAQGALEKLCSVLPSSTETQCKQLVTDVFPLLWEQLQTETDNPEVACSDIGMCSSSMKTLAVVQEQKKTEAEGGVLCVLCEYVMKELESLLITNATEAEIESALEKVCSLLPSTITSDCDEFIKKYSKEIIDALLNGATPKVLCSLLKLCLFSEQKVVVVAEGSEISCESCTLAIGTVKLLIKDNEKSVEDVLETVCNYMPSTIQAECKSFIETYAPQIIQLVDDEIDPKSVCKALKLCESALMKPWTKLLRAKLY